MVEAETKETPNLENYKDDYVEDYAEDYGDDYYNYGYRQNTKHDAGATKFKKIPLYKIDLESQIPDEPQEKHDKPNDSHYTKELEKISKQIETHTKNKEDLHEKIKIEKMGNNPGIGKMIDEIKEIKLKIEGLDKRIKEIGDKNNGVIEIEKKLKEDRDKLEKELDVKDYDRLVAQVQDLQEQLGFSQLSVTEEKKTLDKKNRLESQIPKCKKYKEIREQLKALKEKNEGPFKEIKVLRDEKNKLWDSKKAIQEKVDGLKVSVKANQTVIDQLKLQIDSIREEIKKLNIEYAKIEREWNEKWKKFEAYMDIVEYIREAKKKQNDIRKREEKLKKKEEKDAKKQGQTTGDVEINIIKSDETKETVSCKQLLEFFKNLLPKNESNTQKEQEKNKISDKLADDLKKGLITVVDREALNNQQYLGIAGKGITKKEKNAPKVSKREQKSLSTDHLLLSVDINHQIKEIGLIAPSKKNQVEAFIKTLEVRLVELKALALKARDQFEEKKSLELQK